MEDEKTDTPPNDPDSGPFCILLLDNHRIDPKELQAIFESLKDSVHAVEDLSPEVSDHNAGLIVHLGDAGIDSENMRAAMHHERSGRRHLLLGVFADALSRGMLRDDVARAMQDLSVLALSLPEVSMPPIMYFKERKENKSLPQSRGSRFSAAAAFNPQFKTAPQMNPRRFSPAARPPRKKGYCRSPGAFY